MRSLPPNLNLLATFAIAARERSFTRAAAKVHLTQGAVSRQMRALEDTLGVALFVREARAVSLTAAGQTYFDAVERALALVAEASSALATSRRLTVSVLPSFAALWLLPRLPRFESAHPDLVVELAASYELVDLHTAPVHAAIRYGRGRWEGLVATPILRESLVPVVAPKLARAARGERFWTLPLLSAGAVDEGSGDLDWSAWSEGAGVRIPATAKYVRLRDYQRVLHAARAGRGVAMCRKRLARELVAQGELVAVSRHEVRGKTGYFFVTTPALGDAPAARTFRDWLGREARRRRG